MCTTEHNAQIFPLTFLDKIELNELNDIDLSSQLSSLPPYEVHSKLMTLPSLNDFDMNEKLINVINSKYYDISELRNVYKSKSSFSLFHSNYRSLSKHIDELQILLRSTKISFDIIGVAETKEQVDNGFLTNVNLYGYDLYSQPSNSQRASCESGVWNDFIHDGCLHCLLQSQRSSNFRWLFSFSFFGVFELKFLLYFCFTQKEGHVTTRNKCKIRSKSSAIATWARFLWPTVFLCYFTYPPVQR